MWLFASVITGLCRTEVIVWIYPFILFFVHPFCCFVLLCCVLLLHVMCPSGDTEDASPDVIWTCEKLKRLDLSHNRLRSLPDRFDGLRRLNTLNVSYNYLNDLPQTCSWGSISLVSNSCGYNNERLPCQIILR